MCGPRFIRKHSSAGYTVILAKMLLIGYVNKETGSAIRCTADISFVLASAVQRWMGKGIELLYRLFC
jgi:hypothetical protein